MPPGLVFGLLFASLAASLLYVSGMACNDVFDARFDRAHRSCRPIASGVISRRAASLFAASSAVLGLALCAAVGLVVPAVPNLDALAIGALIWLSALLYNAVHKRAACAVLLMGVCRGLLYPLGFSMVSAGVFSYPRVWLFGGAVCVYVAFLTLAARTEHRLISSRSGLWPRYACAVALVLFVHHGFALLYGTPSLLGLGYGLWRLLVSVFAALCAAWMLFAWRRSPVQGVMFGVASLCVLDFGVLSACALAYEGSGGGLDLVSSLLWCAGPLVCFGLTLSLQRRVMGS